MVTVLKWTGTAGRDAIQVVPVATQGSDGGLELVDGYGIKQST